MAREWVSELHLIIVKRKTRDVNFILALTWPRPSEHKKEMIVKLLKIWKNLNQVLHKNSQIICQRIFSLAHFYFGVRMPLFFRLPNIFNPWSKNSKLMFSLTLRHLYFAQLNTKLFYYPFKSGSLPKYHIIGGRFSK